MSVMTELVLETEPLTATTLTYHFDPVTEKSSVVDSQDVTALVERNKRLQNGPPTVSKTKEWELIGAIPGNVHAELKKRGVIVSQHEDPWQRKLLKWLRDHPKFKTSTRKVI